MALSLPADQGGALAIRGDPGVGKTALLADAAARAADRGMLVLKMVGVQSEARLPFAGLQVLLQPILSRTASFYVDPRIRAGSPGPACES